MYHDLISSSFADMLSELSYDNLVRKAKSKVLYYQMVLYLLI